MKKCFSFDFLKKYFSINVLPYWCILVLDCATIVLAGMWSVYYTLGGVVAISSFWKYVYIWIASLPIFLITMHVFKSYRGVVRKSFVTNLASLSMALLLGGFILLCFCEFVPDVIFPFRPALRATLLMIFISAFLQAFYRFVARRVFYVSGDGQIKHINPFKPMQKDMIGFSVDNSMAERKRINLCLAHMSEAGLEKKYVQEAFDTNWVVPLGPNVNAFEQDLKDFMSPDCEVAALSAGTAAVHLALIASGVRPGDEVCVQSFTFCASANPVVYMGATPVFIDSEPDTWNMDPRLLEEAIKDRIAKTGRKPAAIIPVALYGMPYDVEGILEVANRYDIPVIEDAAEGFGSRFNGKPLGSFGRFGVLSFNGNKMITTSGGGALVCNGSADISPAHAKKNVLWYATQAREAYPYYQHEAIGFNYRMSNVCAGIGRGQMTIVGDHIAHHKHVQQMYEELLADVPGILVHKAPMIVDPEGKTKRYDSNYWLCTLTLEPDIRIKGQENAYNKTITAAVGGAAGVIHAAASATTDCQPNDNVEALRVILDSAQIEARPLWKPMHKQPVYANAPAYVNGISESLFKVGLCLPAGPYVSDDDVRYIVETIKGAIEG